MLPLHHGRVRSVRQDRVWLAVSQPFGLTHWSRKCYHSPDAKRLAHPVEWSPSKESNLDLDLTKITFYR